MFGNVNVIDGPSLSNDVQFTAKERETAGKYNKTTANTFTGGSLKRR